MKTRIFTSIIMLGLLTPLIAARAIAQTGVTVANIPFEFTVCRQQLPAGKYTLRRANATDPHMLLVRSEDNRSVDLACTHDVESRKAVPTGKLIFNRYGNQYFLSEMWMRGERVGNQLIKSEKEEALLRELTPRKKPGKVTVKITEAKPH